MGRLKTAASSRHLYKSARHYCLRLRVKKLSFIFRLANLQAQPEISLYFSSRTRSQDREEKEIVNGRGTWYQQDLVTVYVVSIRMLRFA